MAASGEASLAIAALSLLWLGIAAAVAIAASRRFRVAQDVLEGARANARLLELMPARPIMVRADRRLEADEQLTRNLGLKSPPATLADFAGNDSGIAPEDLEALT